MPRDDELARTATAPSAPAAESETVASGRGSASLAGDGDVGCVVVSPNEPLAVVMIPAVKRR